MARNRSSSAPLTQFGRTTLSKFDFPTPDLLKVARLTLIFRALKVNCSHEEMRTVEFERAMAQLAEKEVLLRRVVKRRETSKATGSAASTGPSAQVSHSPHVLDHFVQSYVDVATKEGIPLPELPVE